MSTTAVRLLALLLLLAFPVPARGVVIYDAYAGFYPANFFYLHDGGGFLPAAVDSFDFSYGGALCPAAGTPNYLCARVRATAGINFGRLFLGAGARMKRTNAQFTQEHGAYAGARIDIYNVGGYASGPAPGAYFVFGLHGTVSSSVTTAAVAVDSYTVATLYAGSGGGVQCFGPGGCPPSSQQQIKVTDWDPATGFSLVLRSDVKMFNPDEVTGWDGEGVADFYDTLELLAVQLLDADDQPIPGVTLTFTDKDGQPIVIPDTPPEPTATATSTPLATATPVLPTPTPTVTPVCANPPCEDCENCVDDDGDGLIDRADPDCAPPADGGGLGLPDPASAKALDKCAKALRKVGAKLTTTTLGALQGCLKAVGDCIQLKAGDVKCLTNAQSKCVKGRTGLAGAQAKLTSSVEKPCGEPAVASASLALTTGLGFAGEATTCSQRGVGSLATVGEVAECVRRQQACGAERVIGFAVPRAAEFLTLGGWDVASELPCLRDASVGGSAGISTDKQKALRKCDLAFQKGTAKLVAARTKSTGACAAAVFTCEQTKPGDGGCLTKASATCTHVSASLPTAEAAFGAAIAKACGGAPLEIADLRAPAGLGLSARDGECVALDGASLTTLDGVSSCLVRHLACRVDQSLANATPRLMELLDTIGR